MIRENRPIDKAFNLFNALFMALLVVSTLFPFLHVVAKAFSGESAILAGKVLVWPLGLQTNAIGLVIGNAVFKRSLVNSVVLVAEGTAVSLFLTLLTAYPLSKPWLFHRKLWLIFFVFTMLFSGGIVPAYLLRHQLRILDSYAAIILPGISVFNMLIMKNFFEEIPESLEESASLDGANNVTILVRIFLPLSLPALATIGLFYAVGYWNGYFAAMMYLTSSTKDPLQIYLRSVIHFASLSELELSQQMSETLMNVTLESVVSATVVASTVPILLVYPFVQRYFVKGLIIGSVKG